jgi:hypothetical protein
MPLEVYIPGQVQFAGQPIPEAAALTLYNPDSDDPHGALTVPAPPPAGARGELLVRGTRDGHEWDVRVPEIEISRSTSVGCEFTIFGRPQRCQRA